MLGEWNQGTENWQQERKRTVIFREKFGHIKLVGIARRQRETSDDWDMDAEQPIRTRVILKLVNRSPRNTETSPSERA